MIKIPLYALIISLLGSCALWQATPSKVLEGQRGIYKGLSVIEQNVNAILDAYEQDNKSAITYHIHFVYEQKIIEIKKSQDSEEEKIAKILELESQRDQEIASTFQKIQDKRILMQTTATNNVVATKKITEAVYNYFSTTPITIDSVDFWIEKIIVVANDKRN